ncbi:MAG: PAS domain S-box protein [Deltaproteobacteria bacterium]|nr:PAS domain S-box protein [Deltaproteobacteria bacterium]
MEKSNLCHVDKRHFLQMEILEQVFDNAQLGIVIANNDQFIERVNPEFTRIFGYKAEEAVGKPIIDLIFPDKSDDKPSDLTERLEMGERFEYEATRRTKEGRMIHVLCKVAPIIINGKKVGGYALYSDISKRIEAQEQLKRSYEEMEMRVESRTKELKEANEKLHSKIQDHELAEQALQESEEKFRLLAENSLTGVFFHQDGRFVYVNHRFSEIFGYTVDELIGQSFEMTVHPDMLEDVRRKVAKRYRKESVHQNYVMKMIGKAGNSIWCDMLVSTTTYKGQPVVSGNVIDITERKLAEERLLEANRQLEQVISRANEMADEAKKANLAKSEFLANMSHEIRTPLNGVMGVLNLLLSTELNNEQLELVETGKRSSDSLLTVINDILDFSKIEAGELDLEFLNFDLRNTVYEVVQLPAILAYEKRLEFAYQIHHGVPSLLRGDPGRLRQILLNLINNAIKFTKKGEVLVHIILEEETDTHAKIKFQVKDTGIGIPKDKLDTIFESFKQSDSSTTREYGGTGLGLSISKKLAGIMNGEIGVESEQGEGSTFWFSVLFEKQPHVERKETDPPVVLKGKRFLLVSTHRTNLNILKGYIESWGCHCDVADAGEMALSLMNAVAKVDSPFDAVIIDMQMHGMDGAEIGKRVKMNPMIKDTIMIMLTSPGLRGDASRLEKLGFAAYLTKPIRRSLLFGCLVNVLGSREHRSHNQEARIITKHSISDERRSKVRILVVEDNIVNQKLTLRLIEKFGFKVDAAANGKEALKALESYPYDIVLIDVQMPEMDGLEATKIIRDLRSKVMDHDIPIIAMTAHAMKGDRERCLEAGMNDYISKPIQPQELFNVIGRFV